MPRLFCFRTVRSLYMSLLCSSYHILDMLNVSVKLLPKFLHIEVAKRTTYSIAESVRV